MFYVSFKNNKLLSLSSPGEIKKNYHSFLVEAVGVFNAYLISCYISVHCITKPTVYYFIYGCIVYWKYHIFLGYFVWDLTTKMSHMCTISLVDLIMKARFLTLHSFCVLTHLVITHISCQPFVISKCVQYQICFSKPLL